MLLGVTCLPQAQISHLREPLNEGMLLGLEGRGAVWWEGGSESPPSVWWGSGLNS